MTQLLAISDAILGEIISSVPPTLAVFVTLFVLRAGQKRNAVALDGKLTQLMTAEKGMARAEGVAQERDRKHNGGPQPVTVENTPDSPAIVAVTTPRKRRKRGKPGMGARRGAS